MKKYILFQLIAFASLTGCINGEDWEDTPQDNFEALWSIIDEHYCFFDYKADAIGLDWNEVHARYANRMTGTMNDNQQFEVLGEMLSELKDGHVNLYAAHDVARNWSWKEDYPKNFNDSIQSLYLGKDYQIASGLKYKILDDNIGYIYCGNFSSSIGEGNISIVLNSLASCTALIVDIRENGGGNLDNANRFASHFTNEKILTGYICHKTGPGHQDFSEWEELWLKPSDGPRWQKPVALLTNRSCYSAANSFVSEMKCCPQVTVIGDKTGGGSGLPFSSELPNGWSVRFSACPMLDVQKQHIEFGIEPDIKVDVQGDDLSNNKDTIIEYAREFLKKLLGNSE